MHFESSVLCCDRYFVVGEKSTHGAPNAYIYQYPSLDIEQTLEHGTEKAYSAAAFNPAGDRLATVGSYPDFMLTVWDWKSGCTLLRSKAFSQEVYCVSFCPYSEGALVTSGDISACLLSVVTWVNFDSCCLVCFLHSKCVAATQQHCNNCSTWCRLCAVSGADAQHARKL